MRILFLTNNPSIAEPLFEWLQSVEGVGNVTFWSEPIRVNYFLEGEIFSGIEFVISYNYRHIIKKDIIDLFPHKIINLHISLLPWNKGASPNLWSFIEETPSGVTIHEIDEGMDTGDILLQREIVFDHETETLESSYEKSHALITDLFRDNWHKIKDGLIEPRSQQGTVHYQKDMRPFEQFIDYNDTVDVFIQKYRKYMLPPPRS